MASKSAQEEGSLLKLSLQAGGLCSSMGEYLQPPMGAFTYSWKTYRENLKCHNLISMGRR